MTRGEWVIWFQGEGGPVARFFDDTSGAFAYLSGWCSNAAGATVIGCGGNVLQVL